jgi:predicted nucleic acid-binding protein
MIVVADTTPLNHLILIDRVELLCVLFDRVLVPTIVRDELAHVGSPLIVRNWIAQRPSWLVVQDPTKLVQLASLVAGEVAAISLANEYASAMLLIDEKRGRAAAKALGLHTLGTLGILENAHRAGLLDDLRADITALVNTSFFVSPEIIATLLARNGLAPPD